MEINSLKKILSAYGSALFYTPAPAKKDEISWLMHNPSYELTADNLKSFSRALLHTGKKVDSGMTAVILAEYEAGYFLEKKLSHFTAGKNPLRIFLYKNENVKRIRSSGLNLFYKNLNKEFSISGFRVDTLKKDYIKNVHHIKKLIYSGDTYQVNYTVKAKFNFSGDSFSLFSLLLFNQSAAYSGYINMGDRVILSLSPELFFRIGGNKITARPMKGTLKRGAVPGHESEEIEQLANNEKEISENLMIVDLLRNDLGRICEYGSVKPRKLFSVEKYETLYQMVSEIEGNLKSDISISSVFENIFPCGSVTGAPKIRTMEIINELEKGKRGIYTGSIGMINKQKKVFNVAIRTIELNRKKGTGEMGLGSGIVWDSNPEKEFEEVLLKGSFLKSPLPYFELFETMLLKDGSILFEKEHFDRLQKSADVLLFRFNRNDAARILRGTAENNNTGEYRLKLMLQKQGKITVEINPMVKYEGKVKAAVSPKRINSENLFFYHKTTNRSTYDREYRKYTRSGYFDVIFLNEKGEICEGAVSNIFIRKEDKWYTPEKSSGLLPGIYRQFLLEHLENVSESKLFLKDLQSADEILFVNSVRGKTKVDELILL